MNTIPSATRVVFLLELPELVDSSPEVFAFFPDIACGPANTFQCYSAVGQHSMCDLEYARECVLARPDQYASLFDELVGIGYELSVLHNI